jgi:hypothetical protein
MRGNWEMTRVETALFFTGVTLVVTMCAMGLG